MVMPQGKSWLKIKPKPDIDLIKENRDLFWKMLHEREQIRLRRKAGKKPPWTDDKILQNYHFTNTFREYDHGSQKLIEFLLGQSSQKKKVWQICLYRLPNHYAFFEKYGFPSRINFDPNEFRKQLEEFKAEGGQIYTKSHITLQCSFKRTRIDTYVDIVTRLHDDFDRFYNGIATIPTLEGKFKHIKSYFGFGPFTSYEVLIDMAYHGIIDYKLLDTWSNAGPGCMQGIEIIYPSTQKTRDYLNKMIKLRDNQHKAFARLGLSKLERDLTLQDIEFCLCEFSKYYKCLHGVGRRRGYEFKSNKNYS